MPSPKPAVIIRREFEATPEVITQQLRACIIGPACQLVRFANAAEKENGFVQRLYSLATQTISGGADVANNSAKDLLASDADGFYAFSKIAANSKVEEDSVKVFMEDALLTYADIVDLDDAANARDFRPTGVTAGTANSIELTSKSWKGLNKATDLAQDVEVGDVVQLYTSSGDTATLIKTTKVTGFVSDFSAAGVTSGYTPQFSNYTPSTTAFTHTTPGGVVFRIDPTGAFNSDSEFSQADQRRITSGRTENPNVPSAQRGIVCWYYFEIQEKSSPTSIRVTLVTDNGLDSAQGTFPGMIPVLELIPGDPTSFATLPSGLKVSIDALGPNVNITTGHAVSFAFGPKHTNYIYNATAGANPAAGELSYRIADQNALNSLTGPVTYTLNCFTGGSVKINNKVVFLGTSNDPSVDDTSVFGFPISGVTNTTGYESPTIGKSGVRLNFGRLASANDYALGFTAGQTISITVNPSQPGRVKVAILADPYTATSAVKRVRLSKERTVEIPKLNGLNNWSLQDIDDAALLRLKLNKNVTIPNPAGGNFNVTAGKLYLQYRSVLSLPRVIGSVNTLSDITSQLGVIDAENPLAYAVYKAWTNANGATVHYIPTISNTLNGLRGFADALELAKGNRNCYSLVPLTTSSEIWNAFVAHVNDESAPNTGRYRILWITPEIDSHFMVQNSPIGNPDAELKATTAPTTLPGTSNRYLLTTVDQDARFTETVQVNDWVRVYTPSLSTGRPTPVEYKVVGVVDNITLIISSAFIPNLVNRPIEIYRDLTSTELASKYVQVAGGFSSERVFAVVPNKGINGLRVDGKPVKNWNVAAAFAGLRSGSRPHQPLSNVELLGFDGLNATIPVFDEPDLDTLRDGGIWVVMNSLDGKIYVERQLSTSTLDNFRKEQSVTCNIDSISFAMADGLRNLVGRININDNNIALVRSNLVEILTSFMNATGSETIGSQLISYTIDSITVPSTANDTVRAKVSVSVPLPMNIIDITIVI